MAQWLSPDLVLGIVPKRVRDWGRLRRRVAYARAGRPRHARAGRPGHGDATDVFEQTRLYTFTSFAGTAPAVLALRW